MATQGGILDIRSSYAGKFAGLIVATLVLTASVGAVIHATVGDEIRSDTRSSLQTTADLEAEELDNWLALTSRQLSTLPRSVAFRSGDPFHASDQLHQVTARESVVGAYYVNLTSRTPVARAGSESILTGDGRLRRSVHARTTTLLDSVDDRVVYSEPFRDPTADTPSLLLVSRTPSQPDRAVVALVDLRKLSAQTLSSADRDDAERVRVVDRNGTVVLSENPDELLSRDSVAADRFVNETGTLTAAGTGGTEMAVGYAASEEQDWITTRRVPTETAYALQSTVSTQILALLAVLMACLGVIGLTLGRNTIRSVRDLSERAEALREGDLETPIESDRRDEFGDLYAAFDETRASLADRIDEVRRERRRAEVARDEVMATNESLERRAAACSDVMGEVAAGDLTRRMRVDGEHDAMNSIAADCNEMLAELEKTIGQLERFADTVEESGDVVGSSAATVRDAAEQVAESIQAVADDVRLQHGDIEAAVESVEAAREAVADGDADAARERLERVARSLDAFADRTEDVMAETETVAAAAEEQAAELTEVSARADELVRYVGPLHEVLDRFETEAEHEFFFPSGPGSPVQQDD